MSVSLSAIAFDPDAITIFEESGDDSTLTDLEVRVARSKALNGEVVIENRGFVEGDRTITVVTPYDESIEFAVKQITKVHPLVYCGTRDGIFTVAPFSARIDSDDITITLFVKEKHE